MVARQHDDPVRWADPIRVLHEETEHADVQNLRLLEPVSGRLLFTGTYAPLIFNR